MTIAASAAASTAHIDGGLTHTATPEHPGVVFSSIVFLYLFLPIVLAGHFLLPRQCRNLWLLLASIGFYAWGEGWFALVMLGSIGFNWMAGLAVQASSGRRRRLVLGTAIALNLLPLAFFKYTGFLSTQVATVAGWFGVELATVEPLHLPIGISFFTFQAISYLVDIAREDIRAQRDPIAYGAYKSMFPQLIAGPIVRYAHVADQLGTRSATLEEVASGIERFVVGLAKKVLLADIVAIPADAIFALPAERLTAGLAWTGIGCYTLQIYLDFSAYSDMAIGLGRILGFRLQENFAYPYAASGMRDFWRRWHISLSTWFRDYVFIPLGGSRAGAWRTARNLVIVFLLCGLWHGPSWSFVAWGAVHGVFLAAEHAGGVGAGGRWRWWAWGYTQAVVVLAWVLFRADTLGEAGTFYRALAGAGIGADPGTLPQLLQADTLLAIAIGSAVALGAWPALRDAVSRRAAGRATGAVGPLRLVRLVVLLVACTAAMVSNAYSPFIYFRF